MLSGFSYYYCVDFKVTLEFVDGGYLNVCSLSSSLRVKGFGDLLRLENKRVSSSIESFRCGGFGAETQLYQFQNTIF